MGEAGYLRHLAKRAAGDIEPTTGEWDQVDKPPWLIADPDVITPDVQRMVWDGIGLREPDATPREKRKAHRNALLRYHEDKLMEVARSEAIAEVRQRSRVTEGPTLDHEPISLAEAMRQDSDPIAWVIDGLHAHGDSTMLVATNKAGKTTLALNLIAALLDGEPFLDEWPTKYPTDCSVLYLNYELAGDRFKTWASALGMTHTDRLMVWNLRGKQFPLDNDAVQDAVARQARLYDAGLIVVDPFQRAFTGDNENDSTQVNRFLGALDQLKDRAGVPNLLVLDHAGHTEKGRARGSSAKGGWPDSTWSLTRGEQEGGTRRHLSAEGRDVSLGKRPLIYDESTHRLTLAADATARMGIAAPELTLADHGLLAVIRAMGERDEVRGATKVRKGFRNLSADKREDAVDAALAMGWITKGRDGPANVYSVTESGRERVDALGKGVIDDG